MSSPPPTTIDWTPATPIQSETSAQQLLQRAQAIGARTIHLKSGERPRFRVEGELLPIGFAALGPKDIARVARELLAHAGLPPAPDGFVSRPFDLSIPDVGRFRVAVYRQRGFLGLTIHCQKILVPSLRCLGLPDHYALPPKICGLTLLGGVQCHELMAALITARKRSHGHLFLLEHQPHYRHTDEAALISQQEIGVDTNNYVSALQEAQDLDADWITLDKIPDEESAALALRMAEDQRRMILAAVPATDPTEAINWFVQRFSPDRRRQVRSSMARVMQSVMTLSDGVGRQLLPEQARATAWCALPLSD